LDGGGRRADAIRRRIHERITSLKTIITRQGAARGRAAGVASTAAALAALWISAGCDSSSFVPAPPPGGDRSLESGLRETYDGKAPAAPSRAAGKSEAKHPDRTARIVELILAQPANGDRAYLEQALRRELGKARIPLRFTAPDSPERSSPEALAAAIRAAADRGVAGLIVEPRDEPVVVDALHDALGRGSAVLLLDRSIPARGGRTIPRIEYTGLADSGRQILEDVLETRRYLKRAHPGRTIVLHHRSDDVYIERCLASLLEPLRAAGEKPEVVAFEGDVDHAIAALRKSLDADPAMDILLVDDQVGMAAGMKLRAEWARARRSDFLLAGYSPYDSRSAELVNRVSALADRSVESYAMKMVQAIRSLLDGKPVGDVVAVPVTFHHQTMLFVPAVEKPAAPEKKAGER
jgi:ABC-type sugar transport system substrate-binding protein